MSVWISNNYLEVSGALAGILFVFLEIRQSVWLWPVGIITSAVYIWVFLTGKLYADMSLQGYYLAISIIGWYWWVRGTGHASASSALRAQGTGHRAQGSGQDMEGESGRLGDGENNELQVSRISQKQGITLSFVFVILYVLMWQVLERLTDSPVPGWDAFITSLSIVATWMLARKIYEHWYLWIIVNSVASVVFFTRELYPTVILYIVYCIMSFVGLVEWKKTIWKAKDE